MARSRLSIEFQDSFPDQEEMVRLAASGFGVEVTDDFRQDVLSTMRGHEVRTIIIESELAGFLSYNHNVLDGNPQEMAVYLKGIVVGSQFHRSGVLAEGLRTLVNEEQPRYLALATQSPRVYETLARTVGEPYPRVDGSVVPEDVEAIGVKIADFEGMQYPMNRGLYGSSLYETVPKSRSRIVQSGFEKLCPNPDQGDSVFFVVILR